MPAKKTLKKIPTKTLNTMLQEIEVSRKPEIEYVYRLIVQSMTGKKPGMTRTQIRSARPAGSLNCLQPLLKAGRIRKASTGRYVPAEQTTKPAKSVAKKAAPAKRKSPVPAYIKARAKRAQMQPPLIMGRSLATKMSQMQQEIDTLQLQLPSVERAREAEKIGTDKRHQLNKDRFHIIQRTRLLREELDRLARAH